MGLIKALKMCGELTKVPDLLILAAAQARGVVLVPRHLIVLGVVPGDQLLPDVPWQLCTRMHFLL